MTHCPGISRVFSSLVSKDLRHATAAVDARTKRLHWGRAWPSSDVLFKARSDEGVLFDRLHARHTSLRVLTVTDDSAGQVVNELFVEALTDAKNLEVCDFSRNRLLTSAALTRLAWFPTAHVARELKQLAIRFCPNVSYEATLRLRSVFDKRPPRVGPLAIIRLPEFMVGTFLCPFESGSEEHCYYADGAFQFSRDGQSVGYVRSTVGVVERGEDSLCVGGDEEGEAKEEAATEEVAVTAGVGGGEENAIKAAGAVGGGDLGEGEGEGGGEGGDLGEDSVDGEGRGEGVASAESTAAVTVDDPLFLPFFPGSDEQDEWFMVKDELQFVDFEPPPGWPAITRFAYRPGVLVRRPKPSELVDEQDTSVFIVQHLQQLRAPSSAPPVDWKGIPVGDSGYHDAAGRRVADGSGVAVEGNHGGDEHIQELAYPYLVSRMVRLPLPGGATCQPPKELLDRIRPFANAMPVDVPDDMFL